MILDLEDMYLRLNNVIGDSWRTAEDKSQKNAEHVNAENDKNTKYTQPGATN